MKHIHSPACRELAAHLPDFLDGEARESICRSIEEHLQSCDDCRIVVDTLKKTITLYRNSPLEKVPSGVHERLVKVLNLGDLVDKPPK
jgi:predicted anti-sigma-YlaC factor YlaD